MTLDLFSMSALISSMVFFPTIQTIIGHYSAFWPGYLGIRSLFSRMSFDFSSCPGPERCIEGVIWCRSFWVCCSVTVLGGTSARSVVSVPWTITERIHILGCWQIRISQKNKLWALYVKNDSICDEHTLNICENTWVWTNPKLSIKLTYCENTNHFVRVLCHLRIISPKHCYQKYAIHVIQSCGIG